MKLYIKYMVSTSCKNAARDALREMGLHFIIVELGEVELMETLNLSQREELKIKLLASGLELMDDKRSVLIERIKNVVIHMVHYSDEVLLINFSDYL
ncbi:MAG: AraC family transcriptional regulator, partial [Sediminibacterium sp.]